MARSDIPIFIGEARGNKQGAKEGNWQSAKGKRVVNFMDGGFWGKCKKGNKQICNSQKINVPDCFFANCLFAPYLFLFRLCDGFALLYLPFRLFQRLGNEPFELAIYAAKLVVGPLPEGRKRRFVYTEHK